ncbi:MAG: secretin N-terminal domain-containing protein [Candidatus Omnitrophota bacterium]
MHKFKKYIIGIYAGVFVLSIFVAGAYRVMAQGEPPQQEEAAPAASPTGNLSDMATITDAGPGKISLDLKGVDVVELLKILAVKMAINIVPTKEVTGRVNVFLNNVTFEDALDIILITNSLAAVKEKNIITVMTLEKYTQLYGKKYKEPRKVRMLSLKHASPKDISSALGQLKTDIGKVIIDEPTGTVILVDIPEALDLMEKTTKTLDSPNDTQIFNLKYAKAEDLKGQLASVFTPGSSNVELDARTNKIAISDLPDKMKKIKRMIEAFDTPTKQVLIEAQIVQISLNDRTQFGIDWEKFFKMAAWGKFSPDFKGKFPVTGLGNYGQMSVGTLAANNFNVVIQALNSIAKTNILSRPRIAVVNNQEASILIGSKEVYFSQTQSQSSVTTTTAESVNYVDVGVKLNVTPTITDDDFVIMKIRPEVSTVRETAVSPLGSKVPVVETSQAETTVKVKDKAMVMIAGLMKEELRDTRAEMPVLRKIPVIRWLFGNKDMAKVKTELAIFITPHIITGDVEKVDAEREQVKARGVLTKKVKTSLE